MVTRGRRAAAAAGALVGALAITVAAGGRGTHDVAASPAGGGAAAARQPWPAEELPLPLSVRTPRDLAVKAAIERQYLVFNLLAGGKVAFDAGDFATAAAKWDALLKLSDLDPEIDKVIRPLALEARANAGTAQAAPNAATPTVIVSGEPALGTAPQAAARRETANVSGVVSGGGSIGPGGTVVWLKRVGGATPRPAPARGKVITQRNKTFIPRVLAIPVGTTVEFLNQDDIFHNVFSLSRPNDFDTGLYRGGVSYPQTFRKSGVVQILCNIHSSMIAYVYVVDSPYYTQADATGAFTIRNVPIGEYELETWHEASLKPFKQRLDVGAEGVRGLAVRVAGDKAAPAFVPDKSGRPRQAHLNY